MLAKVLARNDDGPEREPDTLTLEAEATNVFGLDPEPPRKSQLARLRVRRPMVFARAYTRARRRGGLYMLSAKNAKRSLRARALRRVGRGWNRSSARLFRYMHLHGSEIDVLYALFREADTDRSGTLAVGELMAFLGLEHSDFANRIFCMLEYIRGQAVSGACDFEAYVVSVWNVCTLVPDEYRDFCFELYDADESGYLDRAEILDLVADISTETFAGSERTALLLQDMITMIEESDSDAISKTAFESFCRERPALLGPAYQLRSRMRESFGGAPFWDMIGERRSATGGGGQRATAVDGAGQVSSAFVPLRRLIIERDNARKGPPPPPLARNHEQENERHRNRKTKMAIIEATTRTKSMCMDTSVVQRRQENPLVAVFRRKRGITMEMMEEMERMTRGIRDAAFEVPADYRDDFDLTSNMRRKSALETEAHLRARTRKKLIKWLGYSDDYEGILEDDEFVEIRRRTDAKKKAIDIENRNRKDDEWVENASLGSEGSLDARSAGQIARGVRKNWATVRVRAKDAGDRKRDESESALESAGSALAKVAARNRAARDEDGPEVESDVSDLDEPEIEPDSGDSASGDEADPPAA